MKYENLKWRAYIANEHLDGSIEYYMAKVATVNPGYDYFLVYDSEETDTYEVGIDEVPPIMQYIGRKDIDGEYIYENDIVNFTIYGDELDRLSDFDDLNIKPNMGIVKFENGCIYVKSLSHAGSFDFNIIDEVKVIGNIYENENLIREYENDI